jgi:hypothetical protein
MSLETALADNTAALRELHALLARVSIPAAAEAPPAPKSRSAAPTAPTAPTSPTAEAAPAVAPATTAAASEPTYDDVKRAIIAVSAKKGRDAAVALLAEFGAAKGPDLQGTPEKFGPFVARAAELLA